MGHEMQARFGPAMRAHFGPFFLTRVARIFWTGMAIPGHTSPAVFRTNIFRFLRPTAYTKCTTRAPKMWPWALHRQRNSQAATVQVGRSPPGRRRGPSRQGIAHVDAPTGRKPSASSADHLCLGEQITEIASASAEPSRHRPTLDGPPPRVYLRASRTKPQHNIGNAKHEQCSDGTVP